MEQNLKSTNINELNVFISNMSLHSNDIRLYFGIIVIENNTLINTLVFDFHDNIHQLTQSKHKHNFSVTIHSAIWEYPPLNILNDFIFYYLLNGATQFYIYDMQSNFTDFVIENKWNEWNWPILSDLNIDIELWIYQTNTIFMDMPWLVSNKCQWDNYWQANMMQMWIITHAFFATQMNSKWNLQIDIDEYLIVNKYKYENKMILKYIKQLESENIFVSDIQKYRFDYRICWKNHVVVSNHNLLQLMVFRTREKDKGYNKILYQTNKVKKITVHRAKLNHKNVKRTHGNLRTEKLTNVYFAHLRSMWVTKFNQCEIIVNESILMNQSNLNKNDIQVNSSTHCFDNSVSVVLGWNELPVTIPNQWKC
eukprot:234331_1